MRLGWTFFLSLFRLRLNARSTQHFFVYDLQISLDCVLAYKLAEAAKASRRMTRTGVRGSPGSSVEKLGVLKSWELFLDCGAEAEGKACMFRGGFDPPWPWSRRMFTPLQLAVGNVSCRKDPRRNVRCHCSQMLCTSKDVELPVGWRVAQRSDSKLVKAQPEVRPGISAVTNTGNCILQFPTEPFAGVDPLICVSTRTQQLHTFTPILDLFALSECWCCSCCIWVGLG